MAQHIRFARTYFLAVLLLCFVWPVSAQVMAVRRELRHDVSPPLAEMISATQNLSEADKEKEAEPVRLLPVDPGSANQADTVIQTTAFRAPVDMAPTTGMSFDGLGNGFPGFSICCAPPDTEGAVGLTQYVQWVNTSFAIFDKSTGAVISGPTNGNVLWTGFGGFCETSNRGDPIVTYDKLANRWVFSQFAFPVVGNPVAPFLQCIAVSTTSDATGTYNRYSFQYSNFDDYPKMGVWPDAYYITFNMFNGNTLVGADLCAYDRTAMLAGSAATQVCFQQDASVGGVLPSDVDGTTGPPAGSPNYLMYFGSNSLNLFKFHVDFATPANSTLTGPTVIPVSPFSPLCGGGRNCVPQPGTTQGLDSLADRLMYRLAYRNFGDHESLVVNHSVVAGSSAGVRWYEIQSPGGTPNVVQQSTFAPDTDFRWMGSVAMDKLGNMALGYTISSSTTSPSVAITGRLATDPPSTMQAEAVIAAGTGSQTASLSRWGDYSAMQVDPSDDCTFWYTQEYMKTTGTFNWNTRIASTKFPNCNAAPPVALRFIPVTPCRIADTRNANGTFGGPFVAAQHFRGFTIANSGCSIPNTAQAFSLNVTVVPHGSLGFLTAYACGQARPLASTLNSDGRVKAVAAIVPAGPNGDACFYVTNDTDLVVDIDGYFVPAATANSLAFFPLPPCRLVDTRNGTGSLSGPSLVGGAPGRSFPVVSAPCGLPTTAQAYSLNYTAVPRPQGLGFLTTWPTGQAQPTVSTLNAPTGATTANAAIVPAGTGGAITVFASNDTDLVIDVNGYFAPNPIGGGGLSFFVLPPCRVIDTRNNNGSPLNGQRDVNVDASGCVSPMGVAHAYVFNATVVPSPGGLGFLTLWPQGTTQPTVSTLNAGDAAVTSNMAIVPTNNFQVSVFTSNSSHVILDVLGYFSF